jgi:ubiquinone/menaquinone biosynthesis C-methylase UbiE
MPDVWSTVAELDAGMQSRLADVLETRGADLQQRAMRLSFLDDVPFPPQARVLEVGCGTGVLTRILAQRPEVAEVVGIDPAGSLIERARMLAAGLPQLTFLEGDGRALPIEDGSFDIVIFDSTLSHIPGAEEALGEAFRVLRRPGWLATFDGDYATTTVALSDFDPLQACVNTMMRNSVNDPFLMRRLPALVRQFGFEIEQLRSHGFVDMSGDGYMVTVVERGIDMLHSFGQIGADTSGALKAEVLRRATDGTFFGHIAYTSMIARKPAA